jgi:hypothetical protein
MSPAQDSNSLKTLVKELVLKRKPLSEKFEQNPNDTHVALELKLIDNQIAEYTDRIQSDRKKRK